jgi:hypothetical protein
MQHQSAYKIKVNSGSRIGAINLLFKVFFPPLDPHTPGNTGWLKGADITFGNIY